jgi:eukaryotic-like serine/threonine-protein kinase
MSLDPCPQCGTERTNGLCPLCLLRLGIDLDSPAPGKAGDTLNLSLGTGSASGAMSGDVPNVPLRDMGAVKEHSPTLSTVDISRASTPYRIDGEIARGGMGIILKGRDPDLGLDVAIKVLLEAHRNNGDLVRRFVEEGQIGGQLVHPSIVPVYAMGTLTDGRPFFVMKLVKGRTLFDLLKSRSDPAEDLSRYLSIFEQVCQALAYAHSQGVIHRDLKSLNIMVGAFGEVQTMDWGLAKLLSSPTIPKSDIVIQTNRERGDESVAGDVKGTYHYMPPEQARGEVERVDERADVFALGAILCEILTGRPPYIGRYTEVRDKAARADLADALAQLDACGADAELPALARHCLAHDRDDRPRNAGEVAAAMAAYFAGVQDRLRKAELDRVEAETRAEEESKRRVLADELTVEAEGRAAAERKWRRATLALAASLLLLFGLGGTVASWLRDREVVASRAYEDAQALRNRALADIQSSAAWSAAIEGAKRAEGLLAFGVSSGTRRRVLELRQEVEQTRELLETLVEIRSSRYDDQDGLGTDAAYTDAFRQAGLDVKTSSPPELARQIRARPREVALEMTRALDDWALERRHVADLAGVRRITDVARLADPNPWRDGLRDALNIRGKEARRDDIKILVDSARLDGLDAVSLDLLSQLLMGAGELDAAERVSRAGQRRFPRDAWLNWELATCLVGLNRSKEAISYFVAARSLRPEMGYSLAEMLAEQGETDDSIAVFRDLVQLRPKQGLYRAHLGEILKDRGESREADAFLEAAISAYRAEIQAHPRDAKLHSNLGGALQDQGKLDQAVAEYREAIRLKPDDAFAHGNLGLALRDQGKLDQAVAEYREAIRLKPDDAVTHSNLGLALKAQGKADPAIAECREAIRLKPYQATSHSNLGLALEARGKLDQAVAEYREAIRLKPDLAKAHNNLGAALQAQGKTDAAVAAYREAIRLKPDDAIAHNNLGVALRDQGKLDPAVAACREAIRLKPEFAAPHYNLGLALKAQGKTDAAVAAYREAIRLKPDDAEAHNNLGTTLQAQGKTDDAVAAYREAIRLKPDNAEAHCNLGFALRSQGDYAGSLAMLRRGHQLGSKQPGWRSPSAQWIAEAERMAALAERLPSLLRGDDRPRDVSERLVLARMCYGKKLYAAAARFLAEALEAVPNLGEDRRSQHRYSASRAAALASAGQGKDDPPPDDAAKNKLRGQALDWLKAELAAWTKLLESGPPQARPVVAQTLQHWKVDANLANIRDAEGLAKLPESERKEWQALWAEVDALLARAKGGDAKP